MYDPGVAVRRPNRGDVEDLASLIYRFYRLNEEFDPAWSLREDAAGEARRLAERLSASSDEMVYVAVVDGRVAGYARAAMREYPLLAKPRLAVVTELYVLPAYRGRGIGRLLIAEIMAEAGRRGAHAVAAEVPSRNMVALNIYREQGFREHMKTLIKEL